MFYLFPGIITRRLLIPLRRPITQLTTTRPPLTSKKQYHFWLFYIFPNWIFDWLIKRYEAPSYYSAPVYTEAPKWVLVSLKISFKILILHFSYSDIIRFRATRRRTPRHRSITLSLYTRLGPRTRPQRTATLPQVITLKPQSELFIHNSYYFHY